MSHPKTNNFLDSIHLLFVTTYNFEYNHGNLAFSLLLHVFTVLQKKCVLCSAQFCILPIVSQVCLGTDIRVIILKCPISK